MSPAWRTQPEHAAPSSGRTDEAGPPRAACAASAQACEAATAPAVGAGSYLRAKAAAEWLAALMMLFVVAPVVGCLAILIKLTSEGPVFYSQMRLGRFGRPFRIYKLRTMTHECEQATGPVWSSPADPRVTRLGRVLRDAHLDELPQLWNVLRGDMCLIGPRPERPEIAAQIERALPAFRHRLLVKPGITGFAQVRLQPDSDLDTVREKLAHDLHYVENVSLPLDAWIAFSTLALSLRWAATTASGRKARMTAPIGASSASAAPEAAVATSQAAVPAPFRLEIARDAYGEDEMSRAA